MTSVKEPFLWETARNVDGIAARVVCGIQTGMLNQLSVNLSLI